MALSKNWESPDTILGDPRQANKGSAVKREEKGGPGRLCSHQRMDYFQFPFRMSEFGNLTVTLVVFRFLLVL